MTCQNWIRVSIPSQREGVSGPTYGLMIPYYSLVSIPSQREGVSGLDDTNSDTQSVFVFQFPHNGKVYLDSWNRVCRQQNASFNSLTTGRCIWTPPPLNPVVERAEMAKSKRELREPFFDGQFYPKMRQNPDGHLSKHDFPAKCARNLGPA